MTVWSGILALAGCNVLDNGTLAQIDAVGGPLNADPSRIEILVDLPPGLGIPEGAAVMNVSAVRNDIGARNDASYVLEQGTRDDGLRRFRVAPGDIDRLRAQQSLLREWETEAPDRTEGSLTVDVTGCAIGAGPQPTASLSIFAVVLPNPTPRPLLRGVPVSQIMDATDQRELPAC
ncbi:hypothetical protein [Pseudaestuariivita atlantica]|uniref:Uncharacterized protein n=1 Tax=Pseudaestuariivita atlantica TaxID=1317121 RepID=A0A0L1JPP2_9RHOB|nr:hypothetical protein [Pseudaestuariivita atlantica]KNG93368.1 hypothetical protein ATO11_13090 [Pseudaestuariivita atlantica]